jgi:hypothetical protein
MRFVDRLDLAERQQKRLLCAWLRVHRAYFRDDLSPHPPKPH